MSMITSKIGSLGSSCYRNTITGVTVVRESGSVCIDGAGSGVDGTYQLPEGTLFKLSGDISGQPLINGMSLTGFTSQAVRAEDTDSPQAGGAGRPAHGLSTSTNTGSGWSHNTFKDGTTVSLGHSDRCAALKGTVYHIPDSRGRATMLRLSSDGGEKPLINGMSLEAFLQRAKTAEGVPAPKLGFTVGVGGSMNF